LPSVIQGFEVLTKPKDTEAESFPVFIQVPAGTTRTITFPTEFNAIAISCLIENQDGANAASFMLNSSTATPINLAASTFRSFDNMNIVSITVTAGAAGVVDVFAQVTPNPMFQAQKSPGAPAGRL
jgi:hypothetical protein